MIIAWDEKPVCKWKVKRGILYIYSLISNKRISYLLSFNYVYIRKFPVNFWTIGSSLFHWGEMRFILNMILELARKINYTPLYDMGKGSHLSKLAEMSRINMGIQKGYSIIYNNSLSY